MPLLFFLLFFFFSSIIFYASICLNHMYSGIFVCSICVQTLLCDSYVFGSHLLISAVPLQNQQCSIFAAFVLRLFLFVLADAGALLDTLAE